jgi:RNA polymerase sigma factor (TIGR02999 family)
MHSEAIASDAAHAAFTPPGSITMLLSRANGGDGQAFTHLFPLIYKDLHRIAEGYLRYELQGQTLQPTALVNELYLRLAGYNGLDFRNRSHFFALAARTMRRILVDHARARHAAKRGAGVKVPLDEALDAAPQRDRILVLLDHALDQLAKVDETKAQLVEMRFFAGMTAEDIAGCIDMPVYTVRRELRRAQVWLRREIESWT